MSHRLAVSLMPRLLAASAVAVSTMLPVPQAPAFDVRNFRASDVSVPSCRSASTLSRPARWSSTGRHCV